MVSKSQIKLITSLQQKKYRNKTGLFLVEGLKGIFEFLHSSFELHELYTVDTALFDVSPKKIISVTEAELKKISQLTTPNRALALFKIPEPLPVKEDGLTVVLDDVRDPGNLGTIIRLCDWFGVQQLVCSLNTVDCYNPKVVQATMGSLTRVPIIYTNVVEYLDKNSLPIYGAVMNGDNIYKSTLTEKAVLVVGNEANGVSKEVENLINKKITIPRFGALQQTESLNVATATAILLSEFKRG
jgi:TrmH family RNA methyltransferase